MSLQIPVTSEFVFDNFSHVFGILHTDSDFRKNHMISISYDFILDIQFFETLNYGSL
jgi:hypothetical protein